MTRSDSARLRRCLALRVAIFFGILLPIAYRDWVTLAVAVSGITLAGVTYWRNCRRPRGEAGLE
jgi:hypothetical protein